MEGAVLEYAQEGCPVALGVLAATLELLCEHRPLRRMQRLAAERLAEE